MLLKIKVPLGIITAGCLSLAGVTAVALHFQIQAANHTRDGILDSFATRLKTRQESEIHQLSSLTETIAEMPSVKTAFRAGNRNQLQDALMPIFENLRDKYGIASIYFFMPPATVFLRLHNPQRFGDDVSEYRMMVVKANHDQVLVSGVEYSVGKLNIRGIFPVKDQVGYIGLVEMGSDLEAILEEVKNVTGFDSGVFIAEDLVANTYKLAKQEETQEKPLVGNFRNMGSTRWELIRTVLGTALVAKFQHSSFRYEVTINEEPYGVITEPLVDFSGRRIGFIVGTKSFNSQRQQLRNAVIDIITVTLVVGIVFIAATLVFFNGFFLRPINEIGHRLQRLVQGDYWVTWQDLSGRPNEVGQLARQLEQLQTTLATAKVPEGPDPEGPDHA